MNVKETVKEYYGKELKSNADLKTTACCTIGSIPEYIQEILPLIADEVKDKYYGCGSPIPLLLEGLKVLDLGCGTGKDSYILSNLVGESGRVHGIDMTEEQIAVAIKYLQVQTDRFGYKTPNIQFVHDYLENLSKHFKDESIDLAVSNCVINLVEDKKSVIDQVYKVLKNGGEFFFSDIYADRRIPDSLRNNPVIYGECLGGALYYKDFERLATSAGFSDPRIVSSKAVDITDQEIKNAIGNINFCTVTYRMWKIKGLEDACEEYGHIAIYKGTMPGSPLGFELDESHFFEKNRPEKVCGNTALMLSETRFKDHFRIIGDFTEHFGLFEDCGGSSGDEKGGDCC